MKKNSLKYSVFVFSLVLSQFALAQKKQEKIRTEEVNVVKSYTPTISDAFKIKETPALNEEGTSPKETVKYRIFSFPVASTFTPTKGRAEGVDQEELGRFYKSYATFGFFSDYRDPCFFSYLLYLKKLTLIILKFLLKIM